MSSEASTREQTPVLQSNTSADASPTPGKTLDLWESVRTIIALQNQAPPLTPVSHNVDHPLSFAQERLWLAEQLEPGRAAYNIPLAFQVRGPLDSAALNKSIQILMQRHEALRTTFATKADVPVQMIQPVPDAPLQVIDLRDLRATSEAERDQQAATILKEEAQRPFDLQQGPLLRATLVQVDEQNYRLLLNVHHIVFDGWSEGLLLKELATCYEALTAGQPVDLPELPVQYVDFSVWQRQWLQGDFRDALEHYWQEQLRGDIQALRLPSDRPRPALPTRQSADYLFTLPDSLTQKLKQVARQHRVTLFPFLLAAFQVLLTHYTAQEDILVCTPTANRNRSELRGLIGYFVNLLVLRTDLSGEPTFLEVLERVRQVTSGANAHQDLPIQAIANCAENQQVSLSQVLFALQNTPKQPLNLVGLDVTTLSVDNGAADFDLFLSLTEDAGTLSGTLKYDTDLFDSQSIHALVNHFQHVLDYAAADPEQPISQLLPLSVDEREQLKQKRERVHSSQKVESNRSVDQQDAPRDATELKLTQIWQQVLGLSTVGIRNNFFELGGQSLVAMRMFALIEQRFGTSLPVATLFESPTIEQLASILRDGGKVPSWTSLVPLRTTGSKSPLFCMAPAGITALSFSRLAQYLGDDQPVYVLQAQGLEDPEQPAHTTIEAMVAHYIQEIQSVQPEGPYFIAGMCFGNLVAYETAQQLKAKGQDVALVAMFDPFNLASRELAAPRTLRLSLSYHLTAMSVLDWRGKLSYLYHKAERAVRKAIYKRYRKAGRPLPLALRGFYFQDLSDVIRRKYVAVTYPGRVTLLLASKRPQAQTASIDELEQGWSTLAIAGVDVVSYPGHHDHSLDEPFVQGLASKLRQSIDEAAAAANAAKAEKDAQLV